MTICAVWKSRVSHTKLRLSDWKGKFATRILTIFCHSSKTARSCRATFPSGLSWHPWLWQSGWHGCTTGIVKPLIIKDTWAVVQSYCEGFLATWVLYYLGCVAVVNPRNHSDWWWIYFGNIELMILHLIWSERHKAMRWAVVCRSNCKWNPSQSPYHRISVPCRSRHFFKECLPRYL